MNSLPKEVVEPNASLAFRKNWTLIQLSRVSSAVINDHTLGPGYLLGL